MVPEECGYLIAALLGQVAIVYEQQQSEIRMNVKDRSKWLMKLYRTAFSLHLFDDPDYFAGKDRFSLEPLRQDGKDFLNVEDVSRIAEVILTGYKTCQGGFPLRASDPYISLARRLRTSMPFSRVSLGAAKLMRKWVLRSLKTLPGMMRTLFSMAFSTNFMPSPPGARGKM